ncbi:putative O-methyltransferase [Frankia canadensis]|uniref:Putative O-methyltransferase n=1 Tax=Frankia canadensis TaxID=1836972 RepID=A0A2I2L036_9ACTN|nr:O-methyltransferase [Frankia canadensis]SNQ51269.1 putative O-methyltransferase [Frankia canadensis]SOU58559.1 putative O-methyltransferase [Frankia canadensis]
MSNPADQWATVDDYLVRAVVDEDDALRAARTASQAAGLPSIEVTANQGALLSLFVRMVGGRRVLEVGTLGGYSTIWLARGAGPDGHVVTLELEPHHAQVARQNLDNAGVGDRVEIVVGPAADTLDALVAAGNTDPFDLVFLDADKQNNARYLRAALSLTRPGSAIVVDNVVRAGAVADPAAADDRAQGSRELLDLVRAEPRLTATALQTVGSKGWDGFVLAVVNQGRALQL